MSTQYALLGLHNELVLRAIARTVRHLGYEVKGTASLEEMLRSIEERKREEERLPPFTLYVMDLNLDMPAQETIAPAQEVYQQIKKDIEEGRARFYGVSGDSSVVEMGRQAGLEGLTAVETPSLHHRLTQDLKEGDSGTSRLN